MGKWLANPAPRRSLIYAALLLSLLAVRVSLGHLRWAGNAELHTVLETVATLVALIVGVLALVRYYSRKSGAYLILGSGFLGAALLDVFHLVITSSLCEGCAPTSRAAFLLWTGTPGRFFLSVLMCASILLWRRKARDRREERHRERAIYLLVAGGTLATFALFFWMPLPGNYQPQWPAHRLAGWIPGVFFAFALLGYWWKGVWKSDDFAHGLVLFLISETVGSVAYIPFSTGPFDALHLAAHTLPILGYSFVLADLFRGICRAGREAEAIRSLTGVKESLVEEIAEGRRAQDALQQSRDERNALAISRSEQATYSTLASEIAVLLTEGEDVQPTLQRSAELIFLFLDAAFVRIWTLNKDENVLELLATAGMYTHRNGAHARVPMGQLKIGRIAQQREVHFTNDVQQDPWLSDPEWARREGMVGFAGCPLLVGQEVVGVIAAFSRRPITQTALQTFCSLAGSISQFIGHKRMQAALRESEERVRLLLDSTAEAIYGIDLNGNCTFANRACLRLLGNASPLELLGRNMHAVLHHSRADGSPFPLNECRIFQAFLQGKESHVDDEFLWRADGSGFPAEYWSYPVRKNGEVVGAVVTFLDITERKRAEEEQQKLVSLVESSDDFIALASLEKKIIYLNEGGARMVGLDSADQALGVDISAFHPESVWAEIESQIPVVLKTGHAQQENQLRNFRTGDPIDVLMNAFAVKKPGSNEVLCLAAVMRDITERKRAENTLRTSEERFRIAAENAGDITFDWDLRTGHADVFGSARLGDRAAPRTFEDWKNMVHPDDLPAILSGIGRHIETGERFLGEYRVLGEAGRVFHYSLCGQALRNAAGTPHRWIGLVSDITERKKAEEAISQLAAIVQCSEDAIVGSSLSGTITTWNGGAERLLGYSATEALGASLSTLFPRSDQICDILDRTARGAVSRLDEATFVRKDGREVPVSLTVSPIRKASGEIHGVATIARDISARKKAEIELAHQAQHDHLTGLPNPLFLADRLTSSLLRAGRSGLMVAAIYVDLDGFKFVNDTLGHEAGDELLKEVAVRLKACLRESDTLARMGGDEFMVVLGDLRDEGIARAMAERLRTALHRPFQVAGHELVVTASLGISLYPRDGADVSKLRRSADAAMYEAKRAGKDRVRFFTTAIHDTFLEHLELETELRHALDRNTELSLVYQPIFQAQGGRKTTFEALLRWQHPILGSISPAKFVPVAEECGLIFRLSAWVLKQACRDCRSWQDHGLAGVRVAANVSALEFAGPEFAGNVLRVLEETGLAGELLDLEVTETTLMRDMDESIRKMSLLRARGIRISIDDFGTGYSSLSYLPRLPVDTLKIDRSFVIDVATQATARSLIEGMISLAHSIGKLVIVEGVETPEQMEVLKKIGCDEIQGFLLGQPIALPDFDKPLNGVVLEISEPVPVQA